MDTEMTYNKAVTQLEEIVRKMQSPDCDIDLLSTYTSQALELLKYCREKLTKTDTEVKKCLEALSSE